ncbi:AraC family transcriptional regulator [uncultured Shewanella sp.]|uniref:AraC family transcriptional regulator n=1 Tax=uncultured Shewanella sp. TaxID=173975 RepID=UPI00262E3E6F|nr:AraC family transcriptional regulator [uncultured Shewanella sp.]
MANEKPISFGRTGIFWLFLKAMDDYYGNCINKVNLPKSLFNDPMRPMPLNEMTRYFGVLEESINDELFVAKGGSLIQLENFGPFRSIVYSTPVLFTAIRRFNALAQNIQSGCKVRTGIEKELTCWTYNTQLSIQSERLLDGIVGAWVFIHLLKWYLGKNYTPSEVHLPGSRLGTHGEIEKIFGCPVIWNAKLTMVRFPSEHLKQCIPINRALLPSDSGQTFSLDSIDLPEESDLPRCVYELINYARAFGYPKLEFVADILMISPLTLQRRLQRENLSFSEITKYQLFYHLAPEMLINGESEDIIAAELGFNNPQSFSKAFKKVHEVTPKQYLQNIEDYL